MRISIESITPIVPPGLDRSIFERAAGQAIEEEPTIADFPGKDEAIAEIGGSPDYREWLGRRSLDFLAGELAADRLAWSVPVTLACSTLDEDQIDDIDFVVKATTGK